MPRRKMSFRLAATTTVCVCTLTLHAGLHVDPDTFRFTTVAEGTVITTTVTLLNTAPAPAAAALRPSCDCILTDRATAVVPPYGSTPIVVSFLTDGYTGYHAKTLFIAPHDGSAGYLTFTMEGVILPRARRPEALTRHTTPTAHEDLSTVTPTETPVPRRRIAVPPRPPRRNEPPAASTGTPAPQVGPPVITVALFSNTGCRVCERLARRDIPDAAAALGLRAAVRQYPVEQGDNFSLLLRTERLLGTGNNRLPVLVVGRRLLGGERHIREGLHAALAEAAASAAVTPVLASTGATTGHTDHYHPTLDLLVLAGAALIDGVNPCAFGAIILFVTYLTAVRKRPRRDILVTGACFIVGVFIAYLLIGVGIRRALSHLTGLRYIARTVYGITAAGVFILGILSIADAAAMHRTRSGGTGTVVLKLPAALRWKILDAVERWSRSAYIAPAAFVLGLAISLLEFLCTGQIYLPTIIYMHSVSSLRTSAWLPLLVYCTMFVLPLIIVFGGLLAGMESRALEEFARKHTVTVKIATGIVLLALGTLLGRYALTG